MADFVTCKHCSETGTCAKGVNGKSCPRCIAYWADAISNFKASGDEVGLVCSVCSGKGIAEPSSLKWEYRFPAILASIFVVLAFSLIVFFGWGPNDHFDKVLVFVSTLVGSITGYYFGGERGKGKQPDISKVVQPQDLKHKDAT